MTIKSEGPHRGEFLLSEEPGDRSRDVVTVAQGQNLPAGRIVQVSGNNVVAADGLSDSDGNLIATVAGILYDNVDASADGSNADTPAVIINADATVMRSKLTYPDETSDGNEQALLDAALLALGIKVRESA